MNTKLALVALGLVALMVIGATQGIPVFDTGNNHGAVMIGTRCWTVEKLDGSVIEGCRHNTLTNVGTNATLEQIFFEAGASLGNFTFMAMGNGSAPSSSSTTLDTEMADCGFARALGTASKIGQGNISVSHKFTSSCDGILINSSALLNASSSGVMLAGGTITDQTVNNGENLTLTHYVWFVIA